MQSLGGVEAARRSPSESIESLFKSQVFRTPHAIAVRQGNEALTYKELDRRANQLAQVLRSRGAGPGARVAILVPHSIETVVALLGVLRSGAAYLPLDVDFPVSRLRSSVEYAAVRAVVTISPLASLFGKEQTILALDEGAIDHAPSDYPEVQISPDAPAYLIYSSGSTGKPKGIVIPHRALVNYVKWASSVYLQGGNDSALYSSLAFDLTITAIFVPLITGGAVVTYSSPTGQPPILEVLKDDSVDFIKLTPSHLRLVVEQSALPKRVKTLIVGGENLETALARRTHERFEGRVTIFNEYGPTETTVGCMIHGFDPQKDTRRSVPLGTGGAGATIYLLGTSGQLIENGVGEIYIGGPGLALGYLNQDRLTSERFVPDPFQADQLMYRSGDLAERLSDGTIEFIGRIDDQIKIRGHRIHLNEIRHVLLQHPQIEDCVVRLLTEADGSQALVAYYVSTSPIDTKTLRSFALNSLVPATVPSVFFHLSSLPLTVNGKVRFEALPGLESSSERSIPLSQEPGTETENRMVEIWRRLLRLTHVGVRESFFDLGGDSLAAIRLLAEIEDAFGVRVPTEAMFSEPTIEGLSQRIDRRQERPEGSLLVPLRPTGDRPPLFLMPGIVGELMPYAPLLRYLSPNQPLYAVDDQDAEFTKDTVIEIEALAGKYLEAIREVQPEGPYHLAGYSAGGITAFEIAMQIQASGGRVGLLAIIDGDPPPAVLSAPRHTPRSVGRFITNLAYLAADDVMVSSAADLHQRFESKLRILTHSLRPSNSRNGKEGRRVDIRDIAAVPGLQEHHIPRLEAFLSAIKRYRPGYYEGRLTLLRARAFGLFQPILHDRGWSSLVADLKVRVLKGNHSTILREPLVRHLGLELDKLLDPGRTLNYRSS